jgi:WD40 repeat protein
VLTGSRDTTARLWDAANGAEVRCFKGHSNEVNAAAFSPDGRFVLTGSGGLAGSGLNQADRRDDNLALWDAANGRQARRFGSDSSGITSMAFSPDGRFVLADSELWDATSGTRLHHFESESTLKHLKAAAAFSPDGRFVLIGASLWDATSGAELRRFKSGFWLMSAAFSPDGRFVVIGGDEGTARLWDTTTGEELHRFETPASANGAGCVQAAFFGEMPDPCTTVYAVAVSPDGRFVLTGSLDKTARLWDAATGAEVRRFEHSSYVESVAFSRDGRLILTGGGDKTAHLWDASNGSELRRFEGHSADVNSVNFSPDERFVLTSSLDGTARLWDFTTGRLLASLVSFREGGWAVVDPEGRYDASDPDNAPGLHWLVGPFRTIGLSQLRRYFFTPGLLGAILHGDPLPSVEGLNQIANLPPTVRAKMAGDRAHPLLQVKLTDVDQAGYGRVRRSAGLPVQGC